MKLFHFSGEGISDFSSQAGKRNFHIPHYSEPQPIPVGFHAESRANASVS
jgi:hypothetical protein